LPSIRPMPSLLLSLSLLLTAFAIFGPASALAQSASPPPGRQMVILNDDQMERYLKVLEQLVALGDEAEPMLASAARGGLSDSATAMRYNARMQQAIDSGGFTLASFSEVHWSAMMAYGASELNEHRAELEAAQQQQQAQLEAMKAQLPPEQYEQMMRAMSSLTGMGPLGEVPEANRALVAKYRTRIAALVDEGEQRK